MAVRKTVLSMRLGGSMDEKTRQLVLDTLRKAHEAACSSLVSDLDHLPPPGRQVVQASIEEIHACILRQFEGTLPPAAALERIAALVYGHPAPPVVQVMERYARLLNDLLCAARDRLNSTGQRRDH
jgi:hypothetical protein